MSTKKPRVRVLLNFLRLDDASLLSRVQSVVKGLLDNPAFSNPPIHPSALMAALASYTTALGESADGGKKAVFERRRLREEAIRMLRVLAHYVQSVCNDDPATILSSGFEQTSATRSLPQPLGPTFIRRVDQGNTGQFLVKVANSPRAWSYEVCYAPLDPSGTPGAWASLPVTTVLSPTPCNGLTPGTNYAFKVRALGRLGFSDWSDTVVKMCT